MKLAKVTAITVIKSLRCVGCKRAPNLAEVVEMYDNFGEKLVTGDDERLRWQCLKCGKSK